MENAGRLILQDLIRRFTPFLSWIGLIKDKDILKTDAMAGLTVALVLVPQSMAYAQLAGLPSYVGLYAAFLPTMIAAIFGSSNQLATGPVAIASLMTAAALEPLAIQNPDSYMAYAAILAIMVGVIRLLIGLFHLGIMVDFLSHPVVVGFTNAAALIIASSQLPKIFGISVDKGNHQYEMVWNIIQGIQDTNLMTLAISIISISILLGVKKKKPKWPNVLIAVVICTLLSWAIGFEKMGGAVVGKIQGKLPGFDVPDVELSYVSDLFVPALVIALLGFVEAVSIAKAIASQTRQRVSVNQELVGQGLANIVSGFFHGYVVSGSFSRSAVNFSANAKTGWSSIITGLIVAATLLFLTPLLYHLPQATLAAVIMAAVINLIKFSPIKHAWKVHPHDGFVGVLVFVVTLITAPSIEKGVVSGVIFSLVLYLYRTMHPHFAEVARHEDGTLRNVSLFGLETSDTVSIYRYDGDLYFANTGYLEQKILNGISEKKNIKVIVLDLEAADQVDATGEDMLEKLVDRLKAVGIELYIARSKDHIYKTFERSGLIARLGADHFFRERTLAIQQAKERFGPDIDIEPYLKKKPA